MRCYLVVEHNSDLTALHEVLADLNVEVVTPDRAYSGRVDASGWIPEVNFLLVVFPERDYWETPPAVYIDIGVAIGSGVPVLIVAAPSRKIDTALSPLPSVTVPLANREALAQRLRQFLRLIRPRLPDSEQQATQTSGLVSSVQLDDFRERLHSITPNDARRFVGAGARANPSGLRFEHLVYEIFRAGGAEIDISTNSDSAAMYIPGTEDAFREPLFVETKLVERSVLEQQMIAQLAALSAARGSQFGVLVWYNPRSRAKRTQREHPLPDRVLIFNAEDLLDRLSSTPLAQILKAERNAAVHAVRST